MAGAPIGNQNATRGRIWRQAIERALERRSVSRTDGIREIDALADQLLTLVAAGDLGALKEFGDRIDGKPAQAIIGGEDDEPAVKTLSEIVIRSVPVSG
jgi:hypothetical protein